MSRDGKKYLAAATILLGLISLVCCIVLDDVPARDLAHRYAPMAEAFAEGNWQFAFHPRIPPLATVSGGIIAFIFSCSGFLAMQIASALWHCASLVVLWKLVKRIVPQTPWAAPLTVALGAIFPLTFHMAYSGLRESGKSFVLLLMALALCGIYRRERSWSNCILLGLSCGLAVLTRVEMILIAAVVLTGGLVLAFRKQIKLLPIALAALTAGVCCAVNMVINYYTSGYAVPDQQAVKYLAKVWDGAVPLLPMSGLLLAAVVLVIPTAWLLERLSRKLKLRYLLVALAVVLLVTTLRTVQLDPHREAADYLSDLWEGIFHFGGLFIFLTAAYYAYQGKLSGEMKILLTVFICNLAVSMLAFQLGHKILYISSRYIYSAMPLLLVFMVLGINEVYELLKKFLPVRYVNILLVLSIAGIIGGMFFHMIQPQLRDRCKYKIKRQNVMQLAVMIKQDEPEYKKIKVKKNLRRYESVKAPKVFFTDSDASYTVMAYLAGGSMTMSPAQANYVAGEKLPARFRKKALHIGQVVNRKGKFINLWRVK